MAATKDRVNNDKVAPWLVREITEAIAVLEAAEPWVIEEAEKALLIAAKLLTGLKSREADELWKLVGRVRESAHQALLAPGLTALESHFGNGYSEQDRHNGRSAKPGQALPAGGLSPFAGTPPEEWQASLERSRQRNFSGGISSRGGPVPGTRKRSASSKKK